LDQPEDVVNFWYYMVIDKEGYQITEKLVSLIFFFKIPVSLISILVGNILVIV
jgi:hypothetical protein